MKCIRNHIMRKRNHAIILLVFVILFGLIGISNAYAEELSYDDKLEFTLRIHEITGHMISSLDNINENEYTLAKMHLLHPLAEHSDIVDRLSKNSACYQKLPLVLAMLKATIPEFDKKVTEQRFSYAFNILSECNEEVSAEMDSNFTVDVIGKLLEKSVSEYEKSTHVTGMGQIMEYQDALGLVIRAHMIIPTVEIFDVKYTDSIENDFKELFVAYLDNKPLYEIDFLTSQILDNFGLDYLTTHESVELANPVAYLKKIKYSNDLTMLEIHGERFDTDQRIVIEYFSPVTKKLEMINGTSTSDGKFVIPFEFVYDSFGESIMFTISINDDIVLYEILSVS